jgi:hypothetical protein
MTEKEQIAFNAGWLFRHLRKEDCDTSGLKKDQATFEKEMAFIERQDRSFKIKNADPVLN